MNVAITFRRLLDRNLVQFVPGLRLSGLFGPVRSTWSDVLPNGAEPVLTYSGSAALFCAGKVLGLQVGERVLVPDYNCGHEFEPFLRLGAEVASYPLDASLAPQLDVLAELIGPNVRAVLVTHYFGITQPLDELRTLCNERSIALIEDCAHVLDPADKIGTYGDVAVFSFRKTLPLPNGGALLINNSALRGIRPAPSAPPWQTTVSKLLDLATKDCLRPSGPLRFAVSRLLMIVLLPIALLRYPLVRFDVPNATVWFDPDNEDLDFPTAVLSWGMAPLSQRILMRTPIRAAIARRRENYRYLAQRLTGLAGLELLFHELPDTVCPLFLPVVVENPEALYERLAARGVSTGVWWEDYHPQLDWQASKAARLKDHVLALPVHQDLRPRQLDRLLAELEAGI